MTLIEQLRATKALIQDRKNWTQGEIAKDKFGRDADPFAASAVCFCLYGAAIKAAESRYENSLALRQALDKSSCSIFNTNHVVLNDTLGHAAVMQVLDHAIAEQESQDDGKA